MLSLKNLIITKRIGKVNHRIIRQHNLISLVNISLIEKHTHQEMSEKFAEKDIHQQISEKFADRQNQIIRCI